MSDGKTATELLPCPICGGQPEFQHFDIAPNVRGRIICSCGLEIRQGKFDTEDDLRIIWNTRTPEQAIAATLGSEREAKLERMVQSLYADYHDEWPDRAEEVYAERMNELGLEANC